MNDNARNPVAGRRGIALFCLCSAAAAGWGCGFTRIVWVGPARAKVRKPAKNVRVFFTRKAVPGMFKEVARYSVRSSGTYVRKRPEQLRVAVSRARKRAGRDGCDAIIIDRVNQVESTVLSWLLLFVPLREVYINLEVTGIRFVSTGKGTTT